MARSSPSVVLALAAGLSLGAGCASTASSGGGGGSGDSSLDITLPNLEGAQVSPTAENGNEVFVLAFWATWCQPCQQELSKLNGLHDDRVDRGLRIYAINIDGPDTVAQVAPWVQREGYKFPVLIDRETLVLTRFNPRGDIPYYVVLDANGRVLKDHQGYMTGDMDKLAAFLDTVLTPAS